jgi:hypothetical protein
MAKPKQHIPAKVDTDDVAEAEVRLPNTPTELLASTQIVLSIVVRELAAAKAAAAIAQAAKEEAAEQWVAPSVAAYDANVKEATVLAWCNKGRAKAKKVGGRWLVKTSTVLQRRLELRTDPARPGQWPFDISGSWRP